MKPLHVAGVVVIIFTACLVGYVFTADTIFKPQDEEYKVGLILDIDNAFDAFTMQVAEGVYMLDSVDDVDTCSYVEKTDAKVIENAEYLSTIYEADIIVTAGFNIAEKMTTFAREHPDQKFLSVDTDYTTLGQPENVANIVFRSNEPSYVAGYLAGMTTQSNIIGFIGGVENDIVVPFYEGFKGGIERAEKERGIDISLLSAYVGSFSDLETGGILATEMYGAGADIVYQAAGAAGHSVIMAADERNKYVIGVDVDQSYIAPRAVLFSVVKYIPDSIYDTVLLYKEGQDFSGETLSLGYSDGKYVGVDGFMEGVMSESLIEKAKELERDIAEGKILVPGGA